MLAQNNNTVMEKFAILPDGQVGRYLGYEVRPVTGLTMYKFQVGGGYTFAHPTQINLVDKDQIVNVNGRKSIKL